MIPWIDFLRKYGPVPKNDNMYDEAIQRTAKRAGHSPIKFEHPFKKEVLNNFSTTPFKNVILTGTAGDGKTYLCREVWESLGGSFSEWQSDEPYIRFQHFSGVKIHFIRDLSAWAPPLGESWRQNTELFDVVNLFINSCTSIEARDIFIIAANDGQLVEAFRKVSEEVGSLESVGFFQQIEHMLVDEKQESKELNLRMFNLSRGSSAVLYDLALEALLDHEGWSNCLMDCTKKELCPVFLNYNLLKKEQVRLRLRVLLELCDHSGLHLSIRQILLILANAILGHPQAKDHILHEKDIDQIIDDGTISSGSLYSNVFGENLPERRRSNLVAFEHLERFQIGYETTNSIDNLIIFGDEDENQKELFAELLEGDPFYQADFEFKQAKMAYVDAGDEDSESTERFLQLLRRYRQSLFFLIPLSKEEEYDLWDLTVFRYAGEYTASVVDKINESEESVSRQILGRLVKGLNRIFIGMLLESADKLYLTASGNHIHNSVNRLFIDYVSVRPSKGEKVVIEKDLETQRIMLRVFFDTDVFESLEITLVRYEFLSRVAQNGALPGSFSRECNEDILAFKSRLLSRHKTLQESVRETTDGYVEVKMLNSKNGKPEEHTIVFRP